MTTQADLIREVSERLEEDSSVPRGVVADVVKATFDAMFGALAEGNEVSIANFGKFEVRHRAARAGRNPQTGEAVTIPARDVPAFKPSKTLKDAVGE